MNAEFECDIQVELTEDPADTAKYLREDLSSRVRGFRLAMMADVAQTPTMDDLEELERDLDETADLLDGIEIESVKVSP